MIAAVQLPDGRKYQSAPQIVPAVAATARSSGQFQLVENIAFDGNIANSGFYQVSAEVFQYPRSSYLRIQTQETWLVEPTNFPDIFNAVPPPCYVTADVDPQRINLIKHVVNLKYGIGVELNNYFFEDKTIKFSKNPTLVDQSYEGLTKNKLAADYLTMPVTLNFNFTPNKLTNFSFIFSKV